MSSAAAPLRSEKERQVNALTQRNPLCEDGTSLSTLLSWDSFGAHAQLRQGGRPRLRWSLSECPECENGEITPCLDGEDNDQDQLVDCLIRIAHLLSTVAH